MPDLNEIAHAQDSKCGDCPATAFRVSIVDKGIEPSVGGDVFAIHAPDGFGPEEAKHVARWSGNQLVITYPAGETIYLQKNKVMNVRIRYVQQRAT